MVVVIGEVFCLLGRLGAFGAERNQTELQLKIWPMILVQIASDAVILAQIIQWKIR